MIPEGNFKAFSYKMLLLRLSNTTVYVQLWLLLVLMLIYNNIIIIMIMNNNNK